MQSMMGSLRSSSAGVATWFVLAAMPALASPLTSVSTSGQISGVCGPAFPFLVDSHPSAPVAGQPRRRDRQPHESPLDCKAGAGISGFAFADFPMPTFRAATGGSG
jgi:hypothetical protein